MHLYLIQLYIVVYIICCLLVHVIVHVYSLTHVESVNPPKYWSTKNKACSYYRPAVVNVDGIQYCSNAMQYLA